MGVEIYDKPSGVVRGECRGGLGGAAAPNRPPSAPAGGGPNSIKRKAPVPAGRTNRLSKDRPCLSSPRSVSAANLITPPRIPSPRRRLPHTHTQGGPHFPMRASLIQSDNLKLYCCVFIAAFFLFSLVCSAPEPYEQAGAYYSAHAQQPWHQDRHSWQPDYTSGSPHSGCAARPCPDHT